MDKFHPYPSGYEPLPYPRVFITPVPTRKRETGMNRAQQTTLIILAMGAIATPFWISHVRSEEREAVRTIDYDRCWSIDCKGMVSDRLIARVKGRSY